MTSLRQAKQRLDYIIGISRVDLYKPIQIAEVLHRSRVIGDIDPMILDSYRNASKKWRDSVTERLAGKRCTSSARFQDDLWSESAMSPALLKELDAANKKALGAVERYIYLRYEERYGTVSNLIRLVENSTENTFHLEKLLDLFKNEAGLRRSIDKAYEVVVHSLLETVVTELGATVKVSVDEARRPLLAEFSDLAKIVLGLDENLLSWEQAAHIYRVGVTNAADRGLDMWANFGVAVQVKHMTLNESLADEIARQVESDRVVIVCRDADVKVIETVLKQIGWGSRVCGIIRESDLIDWYKKCLRGDFRESLAKPLLSRLLNGFESEFPQSQTLAHFMQERGYSTIDVPTDWQT